MLPRIQRRLVAARRMPFLSELLVLGGFLVAVQFFPRGAPRSVYAVGAVGAAPLVLAGLAIVLVFRANRFINFAQLALATWTGALFDGLAHGEVLLRGLHALCNCVSRYPGSTAQAINFGVSALLAVSAAILVNVLVYAVVIRRFSRSGQLILTLVTVYLSQVLTGTQGTIRNRLIPQSLVRTGQLPIALKPPVDATILVGGFPVHLADMMLMGSALVAVVGLSLYLRRSETGIAIRAASENPNRARTLGVNIVVVTGRVWALAGLLAGASGVLSGFSGSSAGKSGALTISLEPLVLILAGVVAARFVNLWVVALAGVVVGVLQAAVQLSYGSQAPLDAGLVFAIGGLLLLQRGGTGRADRDDFSGAELVRELRPIPRELRGLDVVRRQLRVGVAIGTAFLLGIPWLISAAQVSLLANYVILTLVGLSVLILSGWAGAATLGQFGFAAIGAWAAASSGLPFPFAVLLGGVAGAVAALVVGIPGLKLRGLSLAVSSAAFAVSAYALFIDTRYLGGLIPATLATPRVLGINLSSPTVYYYLCITVLVLACVAIVELRRTRTGRVLIALRANEPAAQSFGINPLRARLTAFAVAGFLAAVAGALLAYQLGSVAPAAYTADKSLQYFVFTVIGGVGGLAGPLIGFTFGWLLTFLPSDPLLQYTSTGLGALLLLYWLPGGIAQGAYMARDAMLRRIAYRLRIPVPSLMGDRTAAEQGARADLDELRSKPRAPTEPLPLRYTLSGQWALDRLGKAGSTKERVGA